MTASQLQSIIASDVKESYQAITRRGSEETATISIEIGVFFPDSNLL
jgi:hypothetical protein